MGRVEHTVWEGSILCVLGICTVCVGPYSVWRGHIACVRGPHSRGVHTACVEGLHFVCGSILYVGGSIQCVSGSSLCMWVHTVCGSILRVWGSALLPTACGFVQHSYFEFLAKKKMLKILENFSCSSQLLPFLS